MCDPVTITMVATAALTTGAQVYGQHEQAKAQNKAFKQNQRNALVAQNDAYTAQATRANQERDAAGQSSVRNALDAARARASAGAAASDSGISGITVDSLINDITAQEGTNAEDIAANQSFAADQRAREGAGIRSGTVDRINSAPKGNFNPIIGLLQIGASAGSAYAGAQPRTS